MKELYTNYILQTPYDPNMPKWTQIEKEYTIYEAYRCRNCGKVYESQPLECECGENDFETTEVDEYLKEM